MSLPSRRSRVVPRAIISGMVCAVRALFRILSNLLRVVLVPVWLAVRLLTRPKGPWLELRVASKLNELSVAAPAWQRFLPRAQRPKSTSLADVRELCSKIAADSQIRGLLVHLPSLGSGWAGCEALRQSLVQLRAAGKLVVCYLPEGGGSKELYVALAGDRIIASPHSSIAPLGLASGPLYLKRLLDRVGVEVQVQATGEYKSAAEPATRDTMSGPVREQLDALLGTLHEALAGALAARTGMDTARAAQVFARGLLTAAEARELGVLDDVAYEDQLGAQLGSLEAGGAQPAPVPMPAAAYLRWSRMAIWKSVRVAPHIAVVSVRGTIVTQGVGLGGGSARLATVVAALREVRLDKRARAVVLYINSPGGSALASDLIHREVVRLAEQKPVVACFGDVAASGGYYIAAPCARIVAQSVAITGSIGVISVKATISGLLERLGITAETVRTSEHADMFSIARKFSAGEEQNMTEHTRALYGRFLEVVATGRKRAVSEIAEVARGRVWSGRDALAHGLVDVLGGFDRALDEARALVSDLSPDDRKKLLPVVHVSKSPEPPSPYAAPAPAAITAFGALLGALPPQELALAELLFTRENTLYVAVVPADLG